LLWFSKGGINVYNLEKPDEAAYVYKLDTDRYESLLDASIISENEGDYELLVAAKVNNLN